MTAPTRVPGDPSTIEEAADALERVAAALVDARDDLAGQAHRLADAWRGEASDAAVASLDRPAPALDATAERFRAVAPVLRVYASELRAAQTQDTEAGADRAWVANQVAARQVEPGAIPVTAQTAAPASGTGFAGVMADVGNVLASVGNAALDNPLAVAGVVGGAALTTVSVAGFAGGILADLTGVGAVVGIPAGAASAAGVVTGVGLVGAGACDLAHHAVTDDRITPFQVNADGGDPGPGAPAAERIPRVGVPGKNKRVRVLPDDEAVREFFEEVTEGGTELDPGSYPGRVVRSPDGTIVRLRESSNSEGTTIDATLPNGDVLWKVHRYP